MRDVRKDGGAGLFWWNKRQSVCMGGKYFERSDPSSSGNCDGDADVRKGS